ncbi:MAG: NAD-dependent epimerase/dehydratase family protein [Azospirillum sp.]|nr:NAD-dependent epimerase/dehydratase family protein [Azospirillum sp.]
MRVLITGGAGCLGSNLVEHWLPGDHALCTIDNFATGKRQLVTGVPGLEFHEGSIADAELVERVFATFRPTHVVHAAASYKDPADWREDAATNVTGTINVLAAARAAGVRRFLNFQTVLCYGRPETTPIPLDHPLRPFTSYGISKVAGERYVALSGLPYASLRLASVIGPRLAIGPIPTFYKRLKAGQACFCTDATRDFLDMPDFLRAVDLFIADDAPSGAFNVSSGEGRTIRDVYDAVRAHLGLPPDPGVRVAPVGADDVAVVVPDPARTFAAIGWRAQTGFAEAIARQLAWYDAHGVSDVHSHLTAPGPGRPSPER